ncbi:MAG TPA: hypothetical protein VK081_06945 [Planctomycetota bacterium]|nr:hypothetical protein [Planctomycetota bacterium]
MSLIRCLIVILPFTAGAVLATMSDGLAPHRAATLAPAIAAPERAAPQGGTGKVQRTGQIGAWYVYADGTVAVRLDGQDKGQSFSTWFVSPADKTETTRFEHLMLATALRLASSREPLTVAYDPGREKQGKTVRDAVPIAAIMWNTSPAETGEAPEARK